MIEKAKRLRFVSTIAQIETEIRDLYSLRRETFDIGENADITKQIREKAHTLGELKAELYAMNNS